MRGIAELPALLLPLVNVGPPDTKGTHDARTAAWIMALVTYESTPVTAWGLPDRQQSGRLLPASVQLDRSGKSKVDVTYAPLFTNDNDVASRTYLDLFASFALGSKVKLSVGMNNAFDTAPPQTATTYTGTSTLFDVVGRYFFAQVSAKL
jgi:outer membrane receptor protein involved in Fe transport